MKQLLLKSFAVLTVAGGFATDAYCFPKLPRDADNPFLRMRKASPRHAFQTGNERRGAKRTAPTQTLPASDSYQYVFGPDGSDWFATCDWDVEIHELEGGLATEKLIKGYTFTIYDHEMKKVGSIHDTIEFEEDEIRCADAMLGIDITKKFFNYDDKYEVMVSLCMNKPDYTMNIRTKVYSIGGEKEDGNDKAIQVIAGYPVDAINSATTSWDENFYISFLTEIEPDPDGDYAEYIDFLAAYKQEVTTYSKAGLSGGIKEVFRHQTPMLNLPGDQMSCPMFLSRIVDGNLTMMFQQYEKPFFIDPTGMGGNEDVTPDNNLVLDIYQLRGDYTKTMEHLSTTKIPTIPSDADNALYTYYGAGNLRYNEDFDFEHYSSDGRPAFIVSVDEYQIDDDDNYNSSYYVYDADGNRIKTLSENTFTFVNLSDLPGHEPQTMFVHTGDEWTFEFVDLYSAETVTTVDQMYRGYGLSTSIDRVATKEGYQYAAATSNGIADEEEKVLYAPVIWLDSDGEMIRIDKVPVGKGVELARFYIASEALSPYVFNTDKDLEYMLLVKRRVDGANELREEFMIATAEKGVIRTFLPTSELGDIHTVTLLPGATSQLWMTYVKESQYTSVAYDLPFTKFAGGAGTPDDPYLIATAGDFKQITASPAASYRLTADIDCAGMTLPVVANFQGILDGDGHTVRNMTLYGDDNVALFKECNGATVKNINFYDTRISISGNGDGAVITSSAIASKFDNIHIRRLDVAGTGFTGQFAGICCRSWSKTSISECELADATINLPQANGVGGIAGDMRTGASISACSFSGSITGATTIGGIAALTTSGDEVITDCHVDADLKALNTVGGIVGFLDRSKVTHCHVEGTIEATTPSQWTKALAAGGIAGELEGDWEGKAGVSVSGNLIGISAIIVPELDLKEDYPHQLATVHRVVGRTSYNAEPREDENGNPTDEVIYENGVTNNLVLSTLYVIDADFDEKSIEGTSVDKYELTADQLRSNLGFAYGNEATSPWDIQSWPEYAPKLYYETSILITESDINATVDDVFNIEIAILSRIPVTEDELLGDFMCDYDMEVMEMTGGMNFDGKTMAIEFKALKEGSTSFSTSMMGSSATCNVHITKQENVAVDGIEESPDGLRYADGLVTAPGCLISIYDMNGRLLLSGEDRINTECLSAGIYIAVGNNAYGRKSTIKFTR